MWVSNTEIAAFFQPYRMLAESSQPHGEILTRPQADIPTEAFFANLTIDEQFRILEWQLRIQNQLFEVGGWNVSINVNNTLLKDNPERDRFLNLLSRANAPIVLEFTETHPMPPLEESNHLLRAIREFGHRSALDDFGSGLNGMSLLTDYDFDIVKLDRSLIVDISERVEKRQTIGLVREMLDVLGKDHVVEGVETEDTFETLVELGFRCFQGFFFAKPANVTEFGVLTESVEL